jgi:hypothetical protein
VDWRNLRQFGCGVLNPGKIGACICWQKGSEFPDKPANVVNPVSQVRPQLQSDTRIYKAMLATQPVLDILEHRLGLADHSGQAGRGGLRRIVLKQHLAVPDDVVQRRPKAMPQIRRRDQRDGNWIRTHAAGETLQFNIGAGIKARQLAV